MSCMSARYHYTLRILGALRRFGIQSDIAMDAAQDAARWRARLRKGWRPDARRRRQAPDAAASSTDSDASESDREAAASAVPRHGQHTVRPAAAVPTVAADSWPQRDSVCRASNIRRSHKDLECAHSDYRTAFPEWLAMHCQRLHPGLPPEPTHHIHATARRRLRSVHAAAKAPREGVG